MALPSSKETVLENSEELFNKVWFRYLEEINRKTRLETNIKLGGLINVDTNSVSNNSTTQTDLISYNLSANNLKTSGDILEIEAWGVYEANANNKTITLEFGSQTILTTGAIAANDGSWRVKARIIRTGAATQEIISEIISSNSSVANSTTRTAGTQTLGSDITIKCTATGGASNDITQYALIIKLIPNS